MGHDFNPTWFQGSGGDFGLAGGSGIAGNGSTIPALNLFDGGGNTITVGFNLRNTLVPEASTTAIAVIGALVIIFGRGRQTVVELAMGAAAGTGGVRRRVIPQTE